MALTSLVCTVEPTETPVDLATIYAHVNSIIEDGESAPDDEALISTYLDVATSRLHGPNGLLNRALMSSTWRATYDRWPDEIRIPLARCTEVLYIQYLDADGVEQTMTTDQFRYYGIGTDAARIRPASGTSWPAIADDPEAIALTFRAGWTQATLPASIKGAVLELVATAYALREHSAIGGSFSILPSSASAALRDWVVWSS